MLQSSKTFIEEAGTEQSRHESRIKNIRFQCCVKSELLLICCCFMMNLCGWKRGKKMRIVVGGGGETLTAAVPE
jgi:hypothetical protein